MERRLRERFTTFTRFTFDDSSWFYHQGVIELRDTAADARYKLATTGHEDVLDQLVMALDDRRVARRVGTR